MSFPRSDDRDSWIVSPASKFDEYAIHARHRLCTAGSFQPEVAEKPHTRTQPWAPRAMISSNIRERRICSARAAPMTTSISAARSRCDFIADAVAHRRGEARRHERRHSLHDGGPHGAAVPGPRDHDGDAPAVRPVQAMDHGQASRPRSDAGGSLHPLRRMALRAAFGPLPPPAALLLRVRHLRQGSRQVFLDLDRAAEDARRNRHPHGAGAFIAGRRAGEQLRGTDRPIPVRQPVRESR